jgi:hypothetical protein
MIMLEALQAYLVAGATNAANRIYPETAPDTPVTPYVVFSEVFNNNENVLSGSSGLVNTRVQFDFYAPTKLAAKTLQAQVDALMNAWTTQNSSLGGSGGFEAAVKLYRQTMDYSIWHT